MGSKQGAWKFEMRIDSDPANLAAARRALESFSVECGMGQQASHDLGLCLNEALANVIRHAYGGRRDQPIVISAELDADALTVHVRDWGNGVDPSTVPHEPYNPLTPGGVGLICLRRLLDCMTYTPQPDGMLATLVKKRDEERNQEPEARSQ